jgi:hypothetical protein
MKQRDEKDMLPPTAESGQQKKKIGGGAGNRTPDTADMSRML